MSSLQFYGYIRDVIHKDIPYTLYEKKVIDHPLFQRLRKIKQLGFLFYIFPNADHKRFSHSIGTMHVADQTLKSIINNQKNLLKHENKKKELNLEKEKKEEKNIFQGVEILLTEIQQKEQIQILRLAALLHDVGHFPFSHSSENFIHYNHLKKIINRKTLPEWLICELFYESIKKDNLRHEKISIVMIYLLLSDVDIEFFQTFEENPLQNEKEQNSNLEKKNLQKKNELKEKVIREVISLIDPGISLEENSILTKHSRELFLQIISGEIDADRIDYLLRDSYFSGASYGIFDKEHLLKNLCFFIEDDKCILSLKQNGIKAFEHYLFCRYQMYLQIYTHKKNTFFEVVLQELQKITFLEIEITKDSFLDFHDETFFNHLKLRPKYKNHENHFYEKLMKEYIDILKNHRKTWDVFIDLDLFLEENKKTYDEILSFLKEKEEEENFQNSFLIFKSSRSLTKLSYEKESEKKFFVLVLVGEEEQLVKKNIIDCSPLIQSFQQQTNIVNIFCRPEKKSFLKKSLMKKKGLL